MKRGVVSFDLDGTLIDGPFSNVLTDLQDRLVGSGQTELKSSILQRHRDLLVADPLAAYDWDSIVAECLSEAEVQMPFDLVAQLNEHVDRNETRLLHDRTFESLQELRSAGWRVVVLTNGWRRYQEPILRGIGMLDVIDELLAADDVGIPKPSPAAFATARGAAKVHVHVGDRVDHDIVGGNAAGARTVLLRADIALHGSPSPDDHEVTTYLEKLAVHQRSAPVEDPGLMLPDYLATELCDVVAWVKQIHH